MQKVNNMDNCDKYLRGQGWKTFTGHTLKVMGTIDKWVMLRYKRSAPFIEHENEMETLLKKIKAIPQPPKTKLKHG